MTYLKIRFCSFWALWLLLLCPPISSNRHVLLGLTLQWYWHCWDSPDLPVSYQVLACAFVWFLPSHLPVPLTWKSGFFPSCFGVIAKEPEGWNPAVVCVITSEGDQWCYIPVISQIHTQRVDVHKSLQALGTCNCKHLVSSHPHCH